MPAASRLKALWLAYLSQPARDRVLFRAVRKLKPRNIIEIGVGNGTRAVRLISLAQRYQPTAGVRYTAIDLFEGRASDSDEGLYLKQAYRLLRATKARIKLMPGEPGEALSRVANVLTENELVLISSPQPAESLERVWFFLPRMLAAGASIFFRHGAAADAAWRVMASAEIRSLAASDSKRRAA